MCHNKKKGLYEPSFIRIHTRKLSFFFKFITLLFFSFFLPGRHCVGYKKYFFVVHNFKLSRVFGLCIDKKTESCYWITYTRMTRVAIESFVNKRLRLLAVFLLVTMCAETSISFEKSMIFNKFCANIWHFYIKLSHAFQLPRSRSQDRLIKKEVELSKIEPRLGHRCPAGVTLKCGRYSSW